MQEKQTAYDIMQIRMHVQTYYLFNIALVAVGWFSPVRHACVLVFCAQEVVCPSFWPTVLTYIGRGRLPVFSLPLIDLPNGIEFVRCTT